MFHVPRSGFVFRIPVPPNLELRTENIELRTGT
jgi:hypothetical protein